MSRPDPLLRRMAAETTARPEAVARVRDRLVAEAPDAADVRALLRMLPSATPRSAARVRAQLRAPRRRNAWVYAGGGMLLAAAVALLAFAFVGRARPLDAPLASETDWSTLAPTGEVALQYRGTGSLAGTSKAPRLAWEVGTLSVEVQPNAGIDLQVRTREAEVRVVGTGFDVTRDALGTAVTVRHGTVAVLCASGEKLLLTAGDAHTCAPTAPGGLLGRARALGASDPAGALTAAEAGLAAQPPPALAVELSVVRVESLLALGRSNDALTAAEAALAAPGARERDLQALAARAGLAAGGCAAAEPHLRVLAQEGATAPELVAWADCVTETDPAAARAALTAALKNAPPEEEDGIVERLVRLGARGTR